MAAVKPPGDAARIVNMAGIMVFSEQRTTLLELVGEGRLLADKLGTTVTALVANQADLAQAAVDCGADEAILLVIPDKQPLESAAETMAGLAREVDPDIFLLGASLRGKELAARIAGRLGAPLATDAICARLQDGTLEVERLVYGGCGISTQSGTARPHMATIPPRTFAAPVSAPRSGKVREVTVPADGRVTILEQRATARESVDITAASVVVGVGRGLDKQEDLALAEALASAVGGAVGCTRPIAEDLGWLPEERYIGISGRKITPQLYVAVGLSGQVQHVAGVRDAKLIVAVNKDENAPIFKNADYGLVGDLHTILPTLTAELQKLLGTQGGDAHGG